MRVQCNISQDTREREEKYLRGGRRGESGEMKKK
jgi:hypothetical protein